MNAAKLYNIVKAHRGTTALTNRYREINICTYNEAHQAIRKIWNQKLQDAEMYRELANILAVDEITVSKEQFLSLVTNAINNCEIFQMDPLEATVALCDSLNQKGGLSGLAIRLDMFVRKL